MAAIGPIACSLSWMKLSDRLFCLYRIFYLIVDPTFVTLAGIPLLLMDVVPRINNIRLCLLAAVDSVLISAAVCIPCMCYIFSSRLVSRWRHLSFFRFLATDGCVWQVRVIASRLTKLDMLIACFVLAPALYSACPYSLTWQAHMLRSLISCMNAPNNIARYCFARCLRQHQK